MRAPYQVLIIPFRHTVTGLAFAVLKRSDSDAWQFVSDGGEDRNSGDTILNPLPIYSELSIVSPKLPSNLGDGGCHHSVASHTLDATSILMYYAEQRELESRPLRDSRWDMPSGRVP